MEDPGDESVTVDRMVSSGLDQDLMKSPGVRAKSTQRQGQEMQSNPNA